MSIRDRNEKATRNGMIIHRMVNGKRVIATRVETPRDPGVDAGIDAYSSFGGARTGFAEYFARSSSTGAGPDVSYGYDERRSGHPFDGDYGLVGGGELSQTRYEDEDAGRSDLFEQPSIRPRREYFDDASGGHDARDDADDSLFLDDVFDSDASPTVDPDEGRSPKRDPKKDSLIEGRSGFPKCRF